MLIRLLILSLAAVPALAATPAAPAARVEGVALPAWVEHAGVATPLAPGATLEAGDALRTGPGARVLLRLGDGSRVRLGEGARLQVAALAGSTAADGVFRATLAVLGGAFRFTTDVLARNRRAREVSVQFGTLTAGIRGTDLWGRTGGDGDLVLLLEGHIDVSAAGGAPAQLTQRGAGVQAAPGSSASPVQVDDAQIAAYAAQTEIVRGQGALRSGGRARVIAGEAADQAQALALYDRLRAAGYPARVRPRGEAGYLVLLDGLPDRAEAQALAARLGAAFPDLKPRAAGPR